GEGIPRMFEEMETNGLYPPEINIVAGSLFSVILKNQPMYSVEDKEWLRQYDDLNLSPNQKRMLLFARAHGSLFTSKNWQKVCNVDIYTAAKEIKEMVRKGIVRLPQKGGRVYRVMQPFKKEKVIDIPHEYRVIEPLIQKKGFVKNADIRQSLGMSRLQASRLAQRLVDLGLLEMVGEKKGARYIKTK
ncbi:hypothetical protein KAX35_02275, partial [candidate division WOR-3 bacterium]|nr:hypothetical protein [candidate division WOR-3 bacterium]